MKRAWIAALAAGVAVAAAGPAGAYVVVVFNTPYVAQGVAASIALEVTDVAISPTEGEMKKGDVIAKHTVRAYDERILDAPVKGAVRTIPAGAPLYRVDYGQRSSAWCDFAPGIKLILPDRYDCFEDAQDGAFRRLSTGHSQVKFQGFEHSGMVVGQLLATPAPYHSAPPEQQAVAQVGYRYCNGDGVAGPPRFAVAVTPLGQAGPWSFGECAFGVWSDPGDKSKVEVDGIHLTVTAGAEDAFHYKLADQLPPGPMPRLASTGSARPRSGPGASGPALASLATQDDDHTLVPTGAPATVFEGVRTIGQTVVSASVKHGITGVLDNQIRPGMMWRSDTPVEVGQQVFGISAADDKVIWCAPRIKPGTTAYDTACFLPTRPMYWIPHRKPALMPWDSLYNLGQTGSVSSVPSVTRKDITLPPMTVSLVVAEVKPPARPGAPTVLGLDCMMDWGEGPQKFRRLNYEVGANGRGVAFMGVRLRLRAGSDPLAILVETAPPEPPRAAPAAP